MLSFIEFLRAIATMLIANSHFKGVYPNDILSFGGGFGLALFYMISGYLLANIKPDTHFIRWYMKKVTRLYIPLLLFRAIEIGTGYVKLNSLKSAFECLIFPATWFGASMVILYPLFFVYVKYLLPKMGKSLLQKTLAISATLFVITFIVKPPIASLSLSNLKIMPFSIETPYLITLIIWAMCMLIGLYIRKYVQFSEKGHTVLLFFVNLFCIGIFLATKLLTSGGERINLQIFLAPVYIGFALSLFILLQSKEQYLQKMIHTVPGKLIRIISMCSLEIYYVQFIWIKALKDLWFPINWILLVGGILLTAKALKKASDMIYGKIWNR